MKVWLENDIHEVMRSAHELDELTIYGFRIGDLLPLAEILREKRVKPEEIRDWREELSSLLDFALEQVRMSYHKAVDDVLMGFKDPSEELKEWFVKYMPRKEEEEKK